MVVAQKLAIDRQPFLVERLRRFVPAQRGEIARQVVVIDGRLGMIVRQQPSVDRQRLLVQRQGLGVFTLGLEGVRLLDHGVCPLMSVTILFGHREIRPTP